MKINGLNAKEKELEFILEVQKVANRLGMTIDEATTYWSFLSITFTRSKEVLNEQAAL